MPTDGGHNGALGGALVALQKQTVDVPISHGLDLSADPKTPAGLILLRNAVHYGPGRIGKRKGFRRSSAASSRGATRISALGDRAVLWGAGGIETYDPADESISATTAPSAWVPARYSRQTLSWDRDADEWVTHLDSGGITTVVGFRIDATGAFSRYIATYYTASGRLISAESLDATTSSHRGYAKIVDTPQGVRAFYVEKATGHMAFRNISVAGAISAEQQITGSVDPIYTDAVSDGGSCFDVVVIGDDTVLAYISRTTGYPTIGIMAGGSTSSVTVQSVWASGTWQVPIACYRVDGSTVGIVAVEDNAATNWRVQHIAMDTGTLATSRAYIVATLPQALFVSPECLGAVGGVARTGDPAGCAGQVAVTVTTYNLAVVKAMRTTLLYGLGSAAASNAIPFFGSTLWCGPVAVDAARVALGLRFQARGMVQVDPIIEQSGFYWILSDHAELSSVIGQHGRGYAALREPSGAGTYLMGGCSAPANAQLSGETLSAACLLHTSALTTSPVSLDVSRLHMDASELHAAEHDGDLLVGGSSPAMWDGDTLYPQGWTTFPSSPFVQASGGTAPLTMSKTTRIVATYEVTDKRGRRHMSAPSVTPLETTPTIPAECGPILLVPGPALSNQPIDVWSIKLWRTVGDGQIYYRVNYTFASPALPFGYSALLLIPAETDSVITAFERLYTEAQPPNDPAPPYTVGELHQTRLVVVDDEHQTLRYTHAAQRGSPIEHSATLSNALNVELPPSGLVSSSDRLSLLTPSSVWEILGDGLPRSAVGDGYTAPIPLGRTGGCAAQRTMARFGQLAAYRSAQQMAAISGTTPQRWGDAVRLVPWLTTAIDAVVIEDISTALWLCGGGDALAYSYEMDAWSSWDLPCTPVASCVVGGQLLILDDAGYVWAQQADSWVDDDLSTPAWVTLELDTGWLSFGGVGGYSHTWGWHLTAQALSDHQLQAYWGYDFNAALDDQPDIHDCAAVALYPADNYLAAASATSQPGHTIELLPDWERRLATSVRLRIKDAAPSSGVLGTGRGPEWSALAAVVAVRTGGRRTDDSQKIGRVR